MKDGREAGFQTRRDVNPASTSLSEGAANLVGHRQGDGESLVGVDLDPLGVADQHVHDAVRIADAGLVVVQVSAGH